MGQNSWDASIPVELVGLEVVIRALLPQCDYRDERVCTGGAAVSLSSGMAALQNFTCFRKVRKIQDLEAVVHARRPHHLTVPSCVYVSGHEPEAVGAEPFP